MFEFYSVEIGSGGTELPTSVGPLGDVYSRVQVITGKGNQMSRVQIVPLGLFYRGAGSMEREEQVRGPLLGPFQEVLQSHNS